MERDPRLANLPAALVNCATAMVDGTAPPAAIGLEMAVGLGDFLSGHMPAGSAAAMLREYARLIDKAPMPRASATEQELVDLADKADQFIRTLQLAGVDQSAAIATLHNSCVMAVARTRGAAGAVAWLRRVADATEANAIAIDQVAKNR